MIAFVLAWWRLRSPRERLLLQVAAALIVALAPLGLYAVAQNYRDSAAAELRAAQKLSGDIQWMSEHAPRVTASEAEGGLRGAALAAAEAAGLAIARIEPGSGDRLRVAFVAANSVRVYRWIDAVGARGVFVTRSIITRRGAGDDVDAEIELSSAPS